jgi:small subunit ribosomal protein S1
MKRNNYTEYMNVQPEELILSSNIEDENDIEILRTLKSALRTNETILGYCHKCQDNGTLEISFSSRIKGFISRNDVSYKVENDGNVHLDRARSRVGLYVQCKVKEIKEENGTYKVTLSRKEVMQETFTKYSQELKVGMVVKGVVVKFESYGAFVDIGGDVVGLLGIGKIARVFINKAEECLAIGQIIDVIITKFNVKGEGSYDIEFNREELLPTFDEINEYYNEGDTTMGIVKTFNDTGIFIQLSDSYQGMADFIPGRKFKVGDKVRVRLININKAKNRIRLQIQS